MGKKLSSRGQYIVKERSRDKFGIVYGDRVPLEASKRYYEERDLEWQEGTFAPGYSYTTWEKFVEAKKPIKAKTFDRFCDVLGIDPNNVAQSEPKTNWGQAPDLETFHGRKDELGRLEKWIIKDRCRLINIVGFAGIGKTKLALKLAHQVEEEFEYIIWRKLYDTLPLGSLLKELIKFVSDGEETELASTTEGLTQQLLPYLKERRCLLIFDNIESVGHGDREGGYGEEYKDFFQCIGTSKHSSCLLLTSRVKFSNLERIEGIYSDAVRSLELEGLDTEAGQKIFQDIGQKLNCEFQGTEEEWQHLISSYKGNPLALQIVAIHIQKVYRGNLAQFLEHNLRVLQDIKQLFNQHFKNLTSDEQTVMYWLSINREGISIDKLREYLVFDREKRLLPQTLENLDRKIPIERGEDRFTLHSLLMEYITERVIEEVHEEITSGKLELFNSHALIQASAKDYIKDEQIDSTLKPIRNRIKKSSISEPQNSLKNRLPQLLENWDRTIPGYTAGNLINLMHYAGIPIEGYDFSGMTIWQADLQDVELHRVNFAYCKFDNCSFSLVIDDVMAIALHPKQNLIAVADRINGIGLYSLEDWQCYLNLDQSENTKELAFSPNGNFIVSISGGRTVKVWNSDTGECRYTFDNGQQIQSIAFAPDNQTVAIASPTAIVPTSETDSARNKNCTISLWNIQTDECRIIKTEWCWHFTKIIFHSQKNLLFGMNNYDSQLFVWNTDTKKLLCCHDLKVMITENSINRLEKAEVFDLHPSKEILVTGGFFGEIKLWNVKTGKSFKTFENNIEGLSRLCSICFISFSGDGHTIVTVYGNGTIKRWDVNTGRCLQIWSSNEDFIYTTTFSPQNNILAICYGSKVLKLLNVETGEWIKTWQFHSNNINEISISSNGEYLATHSQDNTIRLLNLKLERLSTWRLNHVIYRGSSGNSCRGYFSPDCQTLAIFSESSVIKLFDVKTGQEQKTFKRLPSTGSYPRTPKMKFSPDSNLLGRYSINSSEIILWDLKTKKMLRSIETKINSEIHFMSTFRILFSQNNQYLVNLSDNVNIVDFSQENFRISTTSIIQIWDIETGECCHNFDLPNVFNPRKFDIMAFHPNDRVLVCHDRLQNEILLLNFQTGEFRSTLEVHEAEVRGVFFDSEANIYIVTTINTTIKIWKVGTDEPIQILEGHASDIKGVDFTPDGRRLVSYDIDNNIYVWKIETGNLDRKGCLEMPYNGMNIAGVEGLTNAQKAAWIARGAVETWVSDD